VIAAYLVMLYHSPHLYEHAPNWVYFFASFSIFAYQTLDAIDGKQARRTNTSSALGELFDHGCDAVSTVFLTLIMAMTFSTGGWLLLVNALLLFSGVFFTIWDLYYTNNFDLGVVNVTEALLTTELVLFITGIQVDIWDVSVDILGFEAPLGYFIITLSTMGSIFTTAKRLSFVFFFISYFFCFQHLSCSLCSYAANFS